MWICYEFETYFAKSGSCQKYAIQIMHWFCGLKTLVEIKSPVHFSTVGKTRILRFIIGPLLAKHMEMSEILTNIDHPVEIEGLNTKIILDS